MSFDVFITRELTDGCVLDYGIDDSSELIVALRIQSGMMVWCVATISVLMMCVYLTTRGLLQSPIHCLP